MGLGSLGFSDHKRRKRGKREKQRDVCLCENEVSAIGYGYKDKKDTAMQGPGVV